MENTDKLLDDSPAMTASTISNMKVSDLRRELKSRGLSSTGNKPELAERLQNAISKGFEGIESADEVNEDEVLGDINLLSGDDAKAQEISEDEILGSGNTKDLDASLELLASKPKPVDTLKTKTTLVRSTNVSDIKQAVSPPPPTAKADANLPIDASKENKSNVVTIRTMTTEERLALRAKKFNQPLSTESRLKVRGERFGLTNKTTLPAVKEKVVTAKSAGDMDKLKIRAQRFGQVVSTGLKMVEDKEKLLKRKQRFGTLTTVSAATPGSSNDDEKKKRRAERFGIS